MDQEIDIKEMQDIEIKIMKYFHDFCEKNSIKYILAYGSCIGAIRHDGFIPWDDDIDVLVPIVDFDLLVSNSNLFSEEYALKTINTDERYIYTYGKLADSNTRLSESFDPDHNIGIYIDIFPVYSLPQNGFQRMLRFNWIQFLEILCIATRQPIVKGKNVFRTVVQRILGMIGKSIGLNKLNAQIVKNAKKTKYGSTSYYSVLPPNYGKKEIFNIDLFENRIIHKYENEAFFVSCFYDKYLHQLYGDYMQLPPDEKRVSHHFNVVN